MDTKKSLTIGRYFTKNIEGEDVYALFDYESSDVDIADDTGRKSFTQKDVEFPKKWSALARKIAASKYFFGEQGTSTRENSIKDLVGRTKETIRAWAINHDYFSEKEANLFADEFAYLALDQRMSPNSPFWFNVGTDKIAEAPKKRVQKTAYIINGKGNVVKIPAGKDREHPQTSACFIQGVNDTMEGIMQLAVNEALLFKYGSGTGTNLSTLRSSKEKLSGGGEPSGPLAYWAFYDKVAGIVKSGGKTRRAAKMDILNIWHPDIMEFIDSKTSEEKKLHILIDNGIPATDAQSSVNYQNTNISVRVNDEFMQAVENDGEWQTIPVHNKEMADKMPKYSAKGLLRKIAEGAHFCGDPGLQYHDVINQWNTCPNSGEIDASNPCSEFMWMNNSSCNLASHNLERYIDGEGNFDIESFESAIRTTAIVQDLLIDNSSYPTKEIAQNSHKFRPLGMGYAGLGSLIMSLGLAYDSDGARATAGAITALMTGKAYEASSEMAEKIGAFEEFEKNKEPMLDVMKMHRDSLDNIDREKLPKSLENVLDRAYETWDNVIKRGEEYGFRNSQASLLAPTGTIGFFMDCATKGVEPEIGLVQNKLLSDGGILKLVNPTVKPTLEKLGYKESQVEEILSYVNDKETIEEAPHIKEEHLAIFDCANKPKHATRTISYQGHLKMMAAVQPFLSGAISKTVNLPQEVTVEEIENIYQEAWEMGIKSVALYRDGSKRSQPLSFSKLEEETRVPVRRKLPTTRDGKIHKFDIAGHEGYLTIGEYEDGSPGELFANMSKEGSTIGGWADAFATAISYCLQYGVPLEKLVEKFKNQTFEPRGLVLEGHSNIKTAKSPVDYMFNFIEETYLDKEDKAEQLIRTGEDTIKKIPDNSGGEDKIDDLLIDSFCAQCGAQMYQEGHCNEVCSKCNWVDPKGCGE